MSHTHLYFDYFCDWFWGNILEKIFEKIFNFFKKNLQIILIRFMLKIWQKMSFSKKLKSIYKSSYCLKTNVTVFNEFFCYFLIHWINFKLINIFPWYIKNKTIKKKSYNFNIKLNYDFKTWKNQVNVTLAMVCVIVIAPMGILIFPHCVDGT